MSGQQASHSFSTDKTPHGTLKNVHASDFTISPGHWRKNVNSSPYPVPPRHGGVTEIIRGIEIEDHWRALEDADSEVTKKFVKEQNDVSAFIMRKNSYLTSEHSSLFPGLPAILFEKSSRPPSSNVTTMNV